MGSRKYCDHTGSRAGADNRRVKEFRWFSEDLGIISELRQSLGSCSNSVCVALEMLEDFTAAYKKSGNYR